MHSLEGRPGVKNQNHEALYVNQKASDLRLGLRLLGGSMTKPESQALSGQARTEQIYQATCTVNNTRQSKSSTDRPPRSGDASIVVPCQ